MGDGRKKWHATMMAAGTLFAVTPVSAQQAPVVVEREGAEQVRAGERFEYQLNVRNQSDVPVKDVKVDEFEPGGGAPQSGQQPDGQQQPGQQQAQQGQQQSGATFSRTIPFLAPGETRSLSVSGVAREEGTRQSCMAVDYTPAVCSSIEVVKPDVTMSCTMEDPEVEVLEADRAADGVTLYACDAIALACEMTNTGTAKTRPARLELNLPEGLAVEGGGQSIEVEGIEAGESVEKVIALRPTSSGTYELRPTLATDDGNMEAEPVTVKVVQPQLELAVQAPDREYVSRAVRYNVRLSNRGEVAVPLTRLYVEAPEQLENVSIASEDVAEEPGTYEIGTLPAGATRSLTVSGDAVEPGTVMLEASAAGYCVDSQQKTAEVALEGVPALVLVAFDQRDPVVVGEETIYDIKVKNQGTAAADSVALSGSVGDQFQFVEGTGETEVTGNGKDFSFATVNSLQPGESVEWQVKAKAANSGYSRLNLELQSSATRRPITEQEPTRAIN